MKMEVLDELETPCIIIDMKNVIKNIKEMRTIANTYNCMLRPHIKTHKMQSFAKMQMDYGACGITCAKISEAEVMAEGGLNDIFVAYPLVGDFRIKKAIKLQRRLKRLILAVDSYDGALALNQAALASNIKFEVRLEIDTGAKRTGIPMEEAMDLALKVSKMPGLILGGIYTFKSLIYEGTASSDVAAAGNEEGRLMNEVAQNIRSLGIDIKDISAGSTPTGLSVARTGYVTEIRPGTYIFKDYMLYKQGVAQLDDIAAHIYATVVSTPRKDYAIIDGGTKTFPTDISLNEPPYYYPSYGIIEDSGDLILGRMNEEHGIISSKTGKTGLQVGQRLKLTPIHICTAINMQNYVYIYDEGNLYKQRVDARGMLV